MAFDQFASQNEDYLNACLEENRDEKSFATNFFTKHKIFVQENIANGKNECTKCMHDFIILANKFRLFWNSMRNGDRVVQEHIVI